MKILNNGKFKGLYYLIKLIFLLSKNFYNYMMLFFFVFGLPISLLYYLTDLVVEWRSQKVLGVSLLVIVVVMLATSFFILMEVGSSTFTVSTSVIQMPYYITATILLLRCHFGELAFFVNYYQYHLFQLLCHFTSSSNQQMM